MEANPGPKMIWSDIEYWITEKVNKTTNTKQNFIAISVLVAATAVTSLMTG
jgi:hypothetical protein